jgi:hypothetical protein
MVRLIGYIPLVNKVQKTSFFSTRDIFYHGVLTIQIKISFKTHPHLVNMVLFHHPRWGFTSEERSAPCPHAIPWPSYHGAHHLSWSPLGLKKNYGIPYGCYSIGWYGYQCPILYHQSDNEI